MAEETGSAATAAEIENTAGVSAEIVRGTRKKLVGTVSSDKMDKTIVVTITTIKQHPLYKRTLKRSKKFKAHDENNECGEGDTVEIMECRPLSKEKRWRMVRILERAK